VNGRVFRALFRAIISINNVACAVGGIADRQIAQIRNPD